MSYNPIMLGIVGDSASGKTVIANGIARLLGEQRVALIGADDYLRHPRAQRIQAGVTRLHPDCYRLDILEQHLGLLRRGEPVLKPGVDWRSEELRAPVYVEPRPFIIVEGVFGYFTRAMRGYYDMRIYLEPPENQRIKWKIKHEARERGRSELDVVRELAGAKADAESFVRPQRDWADMVIRFHPLHEQGDTSGVRLNASLIVRPTLARADLPGLAARGAAAGLRLEFDRDMGLPVDRLEIDGDLAARHGAQVEQALWETMAGELHGAGTEALGDLGGGGESHKSFPLALVQLLVTAHMLQAAEQRA